MFIFNSKGQNYRLLLMSVLRSAVYSYADGRTKRRHLDNIIF